MTQALPFNPDPPSLPARALADLPWREPLGVATALRAAPGAVALLSDGESGRWSHVAAEPDAVWEGALEPEPTFARLARSGWSEGVVGLAAYDGGARPATGRVRRPPTAGPT